MFNDLQKLFQRWALRSAITLGLVSGAMFCNPITVHHFDKDGNHKGSYKTVNGITDVGLNYLLDTGFNSGTAVTTWYMGLIDNSGYTALANGDTMSSHAGWNEFTTYTEATRQQWTCGTAASRSITNSTAVTFSVNGSGTVKGIFITSNSTKSGTSGTLWATANFASNVSVVNGDSLKVTYTVSG